MDYKDYVVDLKKKCDAFLAQVKSIGNECAWTDRLLEDILADSDNLKKVYYGTAKNVPLSGNVVSDILADAQARASGAVSEGKEQERGLD